MRIKHLVGSLLVVLPLAVLFGAAAPAQAQLMSKWGHPVFTIGATPYDSTNTGHGNYPGGPGFIPGYGYYPGAGPEHYPWMDGPGTPFDRRTLTSAFAQPLPGSDGPLAPATQGLPAGGTAVIIVKVPAEAALWIDGSETSQGGSYRRFITPPLPAGAHRAYTFQARWRIKDVELTRVERVRVEPNGIFTVNFLTVDSWTGKRVEARQGPRIQD